MTWEEFEALTDAVFGAGLIFFLIFALVFLVR